MLLFQFAVPSRAHIHLLDRRGRHRITRHNPFRLVAAPRTVVKPDRAEHDQEHRREDRHHLKGLLRRVVGKIFNDTEIKGWCKEFEQENGVARVEVAA